MPHGRGGSGGGGGAGVKTPGPPPPPAAAPMSPSASTSMAPSASASIAPSASMAASTSFSGDLSRLAMRGGRGNALLLQLVGAGKSLPLLDYETWQRQYRTGDALLDDYHREMLEALHLLPRVAAKRRLLTALERYFRLRERLLRKAFTAPAAAAAGGGGPVLPVWRQYHASVLQDIFDLQADARTGALSNAGALFLQGVVAREITHNCSLFLKFMQPGGGGRGGGAASAEAAREAAPGAAATVPGPIVSGAGAAAPGFNSLSLPTGSGLLGASFFRHGNPSGSSFGSGSFFGGSRVLGGLSGEDLLALGPVQDSTEIFLSRGATAAKPAKMRPVGPRGLAAILARVRAATELPLMIVGADDTSPDNDQIREFCIRSKTGRGVVDSPMLGARGAGGDAGGDAGGRGEAAAGGEPGGEAATGGAAASFAAAGPGSAGPAGVAPDFRSPPLRAPAAVRMICGNSALCDLSGREPWDLAGRPLRCILEEANATEFETRALREVQRLSKAASATSGSKRLDAAAEAAVAEGSAGGAGAGPALPETVHVRSASSRWGATCCFLFARSLAAPGGDARGGGAWEVAVRDAVVLVPCEPGECFCAAAHRSLHGAAKAGAELQIFLHDLAKAVDDHLERRVTL